MFLQYRHPIGSVGIIWEGCAHALGSSVAGRMHQNVDAENVEALIAVVGILNALHRAVEQRRQCSW